MTSPSTLTRVQFERASKALISKHAHLTSNTTALKGWSWAEHPTFPGLGYLSRTALLQGYARNRDSGLLKDVPESEDIVEDPAVARSTLSESFTCGQSITFSPTFQVPVFYFTIHDSHGCPLTLEEIIHNTSILRRHALPEIQVTPYALVQPNASFPLLSQGDHPTLGTPGWFIHPCGTACGIGELIGERQKAEGMSGVDDDWLHWLETWFMMIENIVDLRGS